MSGHDTKESPMLTIDAHTEVDQTPPATPRRKPSRRIATIAAATLVVTGLAGVAVIRNADSSPVPRSQDDAVRELVEDGFVPAATLSDGTHLAGPRVAPRSHDHYVSELVDGGFVPAATLSDGTHVTGARVATRSHDDYVGELVDRGFVPAATLSDET